mgnify:CR=1 FL=1
MTDYIIEKPALKGTKPEYVLVRYGETGFYNLDELTRHNKKYANRFNASQGHSKKALTQALHSSFSGNWGAST